MTTYGDLRRKDGAMEELIKRDFPEHVCALESVLSIQRDLKKDIGGIVADNCFEPSESTACDQQVLFSLENVYCRTVDLLWNAHYSVLNNHTVDALPQFRTIVEHIVTQYALCLYPDYAMKTLERGNRPTNRRIPANKSTRRKIPFSDFKDKLYAGDRRKALSGYYRYLSKGGTHPDPIIFSPSDRLGAHYSLHQMLALSMFAATSCPGSIDLLTGRASKETKTKVQSIVDECDPYLPLTDSLYPNKPPRSDRLVWKPSRPTRSAPESCHRAENSYFW